jgi:hypothetical protein
MNRAKSGAGAYEFTRAAYDELADAQKQYKLQFIIALLPDEQKGIWVLHVEGHDMSSDAAGRPVVSWTGRWPNSMLQTFEAFLYGACHRVVRMSEACATQDPGEKPASSV